MPRINLLPWRVELRKQRQKELGMMAGAAVVMMALIWLLAHMQMVAMIDHQKQRNRFLQSEIKQLDKKIKKIRHLERKKENLLARMQKVEELQTGRPAIVHLFDEMVASLPEGVYLTSLTQTGQRIKLTGYAQSNARVSSFMRKLERSRWMTNPDLKEIRAEKKGANRLSKFTLTVKHRRKPKPKKE